MLVLEEALAIADAFGVSEEWDNQDDRCDCEYERIGYWFNPYIGAIQEKRICCIDKWMAEKFPEIAQFFRRTQVTPAEWNGETTMPRAIWVRQQANHLGVSIAEARDLVGEAPKGRPIAEKPRIWFPWSGTYVEVSLG